MIPQSINYAPQDEIIRSCTDSFISTDIDDATSRMSQVYVPHKITNLSDNRNFSVNHERVRFNRSSVNVVRYGSDTKITATPMEDYFLIFFSLKGRLLIDAGKDKYQTDPSLVYVVSPEQPIDFEYEGDGIQLNIHVCKKEIEQFIARELDMRFKKSLEFIARPQSLAGSPKALFRFLQYCCEENALMGNEDAAVKKHFENMLFSLLLSGIPNNYSETLEKPSIKPVPHYISKAVSFIDANFAETITIDDVVVASGISERTLFKGFHTHIGLTPMDYLKNKRLDIARSRLKTTGMDKQSVTRVALDCGFKHLSRFSKDYYERFGEKPKHTLAVRQH